MTKPLPITIIGFIALRKIMLNVNQEKLGLPEKEYFNPLMQVDFELQPGGLIPSVNGYLLLSALSYLKGIEEIKSCQYTRINSIVGTKMGNKKIRLEAWSKVQVRVPIEKAGAFYDLSGKQISLDGYPIQLGVPRIFPPFPKPSLRARYVCFSSNQKFPDYKPEKPDPQMFLEIVRCRLSKIGINGIPRLEWNSKRNQWNQSIQNIKGVTIPGYTVIVEGLSDEDSLKLQSLGLGSKRRMGGGWFC